VAFYKFFYDLLRNDLLAYLNEAFEKQEVTISQRRVIITLLSKEDGTSLDLHNWRPITLLNVDSKIAAKALARGLETVLPNKICFSKSDQTGLVNGFRKAFDYLKWPFMMETLNSFISAQAKIADQYTLYQLRLSALINNGYTTNWLQPSRGVRQGCPLSPYLLPILSIRIRSDPAIKKIYLLGNELKLSQFDQSILCRFNISGKAFNIARNFGEIAGLRLNLEKGD